MIQSTNSDGLVIIDGRNLGITIIQDVIIEKYLDRIGAEGLAIYALLAWLAKRGNIPITQTEIGNYFGWTRKTAGKYLDRLFLAGLLEYAHEKPGFKVPNVYTLLNPQDTMGKIYPSGTSTNLYSPLDGQNLPTPPTTIVEEKPSLAMMWNDGVSQLNGAQILKINALEEQYGYETVHDAIMETIGSKTAPELSRLPLSYLESILARWEREGRDAPKPDSTPLWEPWRKVVK